MDIEGDDRDRTDTIEEDVPVYEPLYPELEKMCSHKPCDNESERGERLCEHCISIMRDNGVMQCNYCGQARVSGRYLQNQDDE
jgi:hypothetical protein